MPLFLFALFFVFSFIVLIYRLPAIIWSLVAVLYLASTFWATPPVICTLLIWLFIAAVLSLLYLKVVRDFIALRAYQHASQNIPKLSKTEEEALNAGDTWVEKDIFIGEPNWDRLATISSALSSEEQAFLDNETESLCAMLDNWEISQNKDLPEAVWVFLKEKGFLGLVIAKEYGGKGFSARAHSEIVVKIASRSGVAAVTVMVPNSLGPGELLHYYGTDEQKSKYLPALASGAEIPCFALTEPGAGSDATSLQSEAIVEKRTVDGKKVIGLFIPNLNKRWITLGPVATLIGLAVMLRDPHGLLEEGGEEGITCLLIPRTTEHLEIGNRHLPSEQFFMNGTIRGKNLFVPLSSIIGGQKNAGKGWRMLVECLAVGRSISLPALGTAGSAVSYIATSAFARIRRQFNVEIGQFEGIEERLAEIGGLSYLTNATRLLTIAAVNAKIKPSVASAITKYANTELGRKAVNAAMDVHAGRAVVTGPRNYLMAFYQSIPVSITVEGANIMTRNLLIFGQGSMACHPFIKEEFYAVAKEDKQAFTQLFWKHIGYFLSNCAKTIASAWTGGFFIQVPKSDLKNAYQRLARLSYAFAWLSDFALISLGSSLKRKERLSARLADALSYLYMAMAALRYYQVHDKHPDQRLHALWALSYCFYKAQKAMIAFCNQYPSKPLAFIVRLIAFPFGQTMRMPTDLLEHQLAQAMMRNNHYREGIKKLLYFSGDRKEPLDRMEETLQMMIQHGDLYAKIADLKRYSYTVLKEKLEEKVQAKALSKEEMEQIMAVEKAKWDAVQVDEFAFEAVKKKQFKPVNIEGYCPFDE